MKTKKSAPAIFMYAVIAVTVVLSIACFVLYYGGFAESGAVLWIGIVAFMIMYHFWLRIIMGNVSKLFKISYKQSWFFERAFEKKLYKWLAVKKWKDKALTYNPELFSLNDYTPAQIANTMAKAEVDHWINEIISLSSILFSLLWGETWIFVITAVAAMLFDAQFIIIQRYNRPRIIKYLERRAHECNSNL